MLAAIGATSEQRLRAILGSCELTVVLTMEALRERLDCQRFDFILIGTRFDESQALVALEHVLSRGLACPVACARIMPFHSAYSERAFDAFVTAARALGCRHFLDLASYPENDDGRIRALQTLRALGC